MVDKGLLLLRAEKVDILLHTLFSLNPICLVKIQKSKVQYVYQCIIQRWEPQNIYMKKAREVKRERSVWVKPSQLKSVLNKRFSKYSAGLSLIRQEMGRYDFVMPRQWHARPFIETLPGEIALEVKGTTLRRVYSKAVLYSLDSGQ